MRHSANLANTCFKCHGPDDETREADLRLDTAASAFAEHDGQRPIVAGDPSRSAVIARVTSQDADMRMPPVDSGLELTEHQIDLLRRWIKEGAVYDQHCSFRPIQHPQLPVLSGSHRLEHPVGTDHVR